MKQSERAELAELRQRLGITPPPDGSNRGRYVLEGTWIGYRSSQDRVVHREAIKNRPDFVKWLEQTHSITYTDGTSLCLYLREAKPYEKVEVRNSYGKLIYDCYRAGVTSVQALLDKEKVTA